MGTRHLIQVVVDGQVKIAQYGQWDGYPMGQGRGIAAFLRTADLDAFADAARQTRFISAAELKAITDKYAPGAGGWMDKDQTDRLTADYPELVRDTGSDVLDLVLNGKRELADQSAFLQDTLFCEWAYVVNLDTDTVKVIHGHPLRLEHTYSFAEFVALTDEQLVALEAEGE